MSIVYLEISSWLGLSFEATHYYGQLLGKHKDEKLFKSVTLYNILSAQEAKQRTELDFEFREGMEVSGFDTKDEIIQLALKTYSNHFPDADILILGSYSVAEPQHIIDMNNKKKIERLNLLFKQAENIDFWDNDVVLMQKIEDEWRSVLNEI